MKNLFCFDYILIKQKTINYIIYLRDTRAVTNKIILLICITIVNTNRLCNITYDFNSFRLSQTAIMLISDYLLDGFFRNKIIARFEIP